MSTSLRPHLESKTPGRCRVLAAPPASPRTASPVPKHTHRPAGLLHLCLLAPPSPPRLYRTYLRCPDAQALFLRGQELFSRRPLVAGSVPHYSAHLTFRDSFQRLSPPRPEFPEGLEGRLRLCDPQAVRSELTCFRSPGGFPRTHPREPRLQAQGGPGIAQGPRVQKLGGRQPSTTQPMFVNMET